MQTNYVLIDYENVPAASVALLKGVHYQVWVFLGPSNTKLPSDFVMAMQELQERGKYVEVKNAGRNAVDFHMAYYLGGLVKADPAGSFHIISKDKGFRPLIQHLKEKKCVVAQSESIEAMPGLSRKAKPGMSNSEAGEETRVNIMIDDLKKRKVAKPRKAKALLSAIQARFGKELPPTAITGVYDALVKGGFVKVEGTNVSYNLPS